MTEFEHELILNHITYGESVPPFKKNFENYKMMAHLFLSHKGRRVFESDIVAMYYEGIELETVFALQPERFIPGGSYDKDGTRQETWYDIWGMDEIVRGDDFFDYFFICKLRHQSLLDVDDFLSFHLAYSFKDNKQEFFRFLQLALRQHKEMVLNQNLIETVQEWIKANNDELPKSEQTDTLYDKKIKGRLERTADDKQTCLTQVQTALLMVFMQRAGMILNEKTLNFAQMGHAFNVLTGFSDTTLRMGVGAKNVIDSAKFEDFKDLHDAVLRMATLIEAYTRKNKGS